MNNDWLFEPVDPSTGKIAPTGKPYPHAVQGVKPQGKRVMGYGMQEEEAYTDAREKAQRYDAQEVLGQRGEAIAGAFLYDTSTWRVK